MSITLPGTDSKSLLKIGGLGDYFPFLLGTQKAYFQCKQKAVSFRVKAMKADRFHVRRLPQNQARQAHRRYHPHPKASLSPKKPKNTDIFHALFGLKYLVCW